MQHAEQELVQLPFLAVRAVAVGRRIQYDSIVLIAAAGFPLGKLEGVLNHPANAVQAASFHIFTRPGDYLAHGIQMGDIGPCALGGKGGGSGVCKEVQDLGGWKAVCLVDTAEA